MKVQLSDRFTVEVVQGDVTRQDVEAIAIPLNESIHGPRPPHELARYLVRGIRSGQVIVAPGVNTRYRHIAHVAPIVKRRGFEESELHGTVVAVIHSIIKTDSQSVAIGDIAPGYHPTHAVDMLMSTVIGMLDGEEDIITYGIKLQRVVFVGETEERSRRMKNVLKRLLASPYLTLDEVN